LCRYQKDRPNAQRHRLAHGEEGCRGAGGRSGRLTQRNAGGEGEVPGNLLTAPTLEGLGRRVWETTALEQGMGYLGVECLEAGAGRNWQMWATRVGLEA